MNLTHLALSGFRSFKHKHEVAFDKGAVFVLGRNHDDPAFDSNGGGKTTLCAAIPWALYGQLSTAAQKDQIIHREVDKASVELRFGEDLMVRRSKERGHPEVLSFWYEGRWHEGDLAATQEKLVRVIGVSSSLFFNSLWIDAQSKAVQFLWATPGKRLEILEELMSDGIYTLARSKAEEKRKALEHKKAMAKGKIEAFVAAEERERQAINRAKAEMAQAVTARTSRVAKQNQRQVDLRVEIGRLQAEVDSLEVQDTPDAITAQIQRFEYELSQIEQQGNAIPLPPTLPEAGTTCPTCLQGIPAEHVHAIHRKAEDGIKKRKELHEAADRAREQRDKAKQRLREFASTSAQRNSVERLLRDRQRELSDLAQTPTNDPYIDSLQQTIEAAKDALDGLQRNIQQHEQIMHECAQKIPLYKFWETGFGARGIRSLLLDDVRAILAYHTEVYAAALAGEQIRIEFPAGDKGFEILLHTPAGTAELNTFSRGEAWRANLGVLLALRKTVAHLSATRLSLLVLDDPCGDLDDSGVRAVVNTVQALASEFGTVLVTLPRHVDNVSDDDIIRVEKRQGVSTLVVTEEV